MIKIDVTSSKYNCNMVINQKITVIRGNSGKGKSKFTEAVEDASGAYKISLSDTNYELVVPSNKDWYKTISRNIEHKDRCIYIIDDADYVFNMEFYKLFNTDRYSFYIIINRFTDFNTKSLGGLPFCIDEVYSFVANGKNHYLEPYYEFKDENITENNVKNKIQHILTEDSNSGFEFFSYINKNTQTSNGRDNIIKMLNNFNGNVLLLADRAALGSSFDEIMEKASLGNVGVSIPKNYLSFEYFLLRSNFFNYNTANISNSQICMYESAEQMYEDILEKLTQGKPYQYKKEHISRCYMLNCCAMRKKRELLGGCNKGISSSNKLNQMFNNTEFETLMKIIPLI